MIIEIKIQKWKTERWDEEVHTHFDVIITIIFTRVIRRYKSNMLLCCWLRDASYPSTRVSIIIMTSLWNLNKVFLSHFLYHLRSTQMYCSDTVGWSQDENAGADQWATLNLRHRYRSVCEEKFTTNKMHDLRAFVTS